jgi:hypothetical protein
LRGRRARGSDSEGDSDDDEEYDEIGGRDRAFAAAELAAQGLREVSLLIHFIYLHCLLLLKMAGFTLLDECAACGGDG